MQYIPIIFSSDNNYAQHMGIALISLFENKLPNTKYKIYVINGGISESNRNKLSQIENKYNFFINYLKINTIDLKNLPLIDRNAHHLSIAAYFRLFIPNLITEKKIIYLDSDLIVKSDLSTLFNSNIDDYAIGAITDIMAKKLKQRDNELYKIYINSGVLLINTNNWRKYGITEKAINYAKKHPNKMEYADQDAINYTCQNYIKLINKEYNTQVSHLFDYKYRTGTKSMHIIHYIGKIKPWHFLYNGPYKKLYKKYLKISPWKNYRYLDKNLKVTIQKGIDFLKIIIIFITSKNILNKIIKIKHKLGNQFKQKRYEQLQ